MSLRSVVRKIYEKSVFQRNRFLSTATRASVVRHSHLYRNSWTSRAPCKVLGYNGKYWLEKNAFHDFGFQVDRERSITNEEQVDPFTLVADELALMANRLRTMVVTEIPKLATAAEYFFKMGVEGKRFRPMVLLLMASSLTMAVPEMAANSLHEGFAKELRLRQQRIAEITEMIHVASLLHDDVLDDAETRRGISSLNFMMGNKLAVLAGDFLLSRASVALASLKDTEVVELLSKVLEHLVTGEIMQMTTSSEQCCSMEYYMQKTFCKTASLMANSCKAIALLAGQPREVAMLAYDYGRNLGLAYQLVDDVLDYTGTTASLGKGPLSDIRQGIVTAPMLYALEEFPELHGVIGRRFKKSGDVDYALEILGKSQGIRKAKQLAAEHADRAASAVDSFPASDIENVKVCRKALVDLTKKVITRTK
ncbi:solanesyl-diphosphate synthase 1, mitochondrial isoform X1 [Cryptomeria japonica]|uniref:solanesyl-diphosphate synthase 1, mitochondrial isoform X1 n=2 Tax=Cryptomeria japonica TaxID=3369 RepID=UPI0025AC5DF0|nr:solanesyl-diphosphate synthase 1, mitochondrial isoform X1 [Cryptomeria japonica]